MLEWVLRSRCWQKGFKEAWEEVVTLNLFPKASWQPNLVLYTNSPSTWEEAGGFWVENHPLIHSKLGVSLGYVRPYLRLPLQQWKRN